MKIFFFSKWLVSAYVGDNFFIHRTANTDAQAKADVKPKLVKRRDVMQLLLEESNGSIAGYEDFAFLPNGRIRTPDNDVISVFQFMHDYV